MQEDKQFKAMPLQPCYDFLDANGLPAEAARILDTLLGKGIYYQRVRRGMLLEV